MSNNLPKAFLFGAGTTGRSLLPIVSKDYQVMGYLDNDPSLYSREHNPPVFTPEMAIGKMDFDVIVIGSYPGMRPITKQLLDLGVEQGKIITKYVSTQVEARILFLDRLGEMLYEKGIDGSVAEGGVFQGDFAKEINRVFPDRKLYLFDTFSGFDARDVSMELEKGFSNSEAGRLSATNENAVLKILPHPELCAIRKGYFPESAEGLDNETFCFVNLDFDLYLPTYAGLEFFAPRMSDGGVILVHDYFSEGFKGVKKAVEEYSKKNALYLFPIGDGVSIGIRCNASN